MSQFHQIRCAVCGRVESTWTSVDDVLPPFADWMRLPGADLCPKCSTGKVVVRTIAPIARGTA